MGNTPQPGRHYDSDKQTTNRGLNFLGGRKHCEHCRKVFRISSPDDVEHNIGEMYRSLLCGFNIYVIVTREWSSEGPSFLIEEIVGRLWEYVHRRQLKRFHMTRVHFLTE